MRDRFRGLLAYVTSPRADLSWPQLQAITPVYAVTKRAANRLIGFGDAHKRCAFADLYAAQHKISQDIFELLDAEHTKLSIVRQRLFECRHKKEDDTFMNAWRYKRDTKAFHKRVQVMVNGCVMLATRAPRVTGSASGYVPPAINLTPPSPSIHPTYISCDASASDADDSYNLHTPTDSEFSHEGLEEDKKLIEDCYPISGTYRTLDYLPLLDVIQEKSPSGSDTSRDGHADSRLPVLSEIAEEDGEDNVAMEVDETPATPQEPRSADVPQSPSDDMLQDGDSTPSSSSEAELTAELITAEIMVGTPITSGAASCVEMHEEKPDMCVGVDYDDPTEYIDMYLHGYGIDPRGYWRLTCSLTRPFLQQIADVFKRDGLIAGVDMLDSLLRQSAVQFIQTRTHHEVENVISYTTELVSPSDPLVSSPRPALAGAVGEIVCPPNTEILEPHEMHEDPDDIDHASIAAEPYGPSRSTTVDDQPVGEAPDGHLGDQLAFMMQHLPRPASTSTFGGPATPKGPHRPADERSPEMKQQQEEHPRLWNIRLSPQPTILSLPVTPTSNDSEMGLAL